MVHLTVLLRLPVACSRAVSQFLTIGSGMNGGLGLYDDLAFREDETIVGPIVLTASNEKIKRLPPPGSLSTRNSVWCRSAIHLARARPSPEPAEGPVPCGATR